MLNGALIPGQRLPSQAELCERFRSSVTVIREALQQLNARGLIRTVNGVGSFVADRSVEPLKRSMLHYAGSARQIHEYSELMDLRLMIETFCVQRLAQNNTPEAIARLRACLDRMEHFRSDVDRFADADVDFHSALVEPCGNALIKALHSSLLPEMGRFMHMTYVTNGQIDRNYGEHLAIFRAVERGNMDDAFTRLRSHLEYARRANTEIIAGMTKSGTDMGKTQDKQSARLNEISRHRDNRTLRSDIVGSRRR